MDSATVIGLVIAWGAVFGSLLLEGGSAKELFNLPAILLVVFGTIGATIIGTSIKTITSIPAIIKNAIEDKELDPHEVIDIMVVCAKRARRSGVLALESVAQKVDNKFLKKSIELIVDGTPSVMVREVLETEIVTMQERHKAGETVFSMMGGYSPTLGIIGTVMGLISMLAKLNEPGKMGHAIATAFTATLYGVILANLVYLPIAGKLKTKTAEETVIYEMIIEGVLSIQSGDSPRTVETRMVSFLSPDLRAQRIARTASDNVEDIAA